MWKVCSFWLNICGILLKREGEGGFMNDSGLFKNIRDFYDKYIDNKFVRFVLLIGAGGFGLLFGKLADVQFFRDCLGLHKTVSEYLATAVVGIFVFILLWYFRTRDVRQQIEKTQEQIDKFQKQINQDHFNHAVGNLISGSFTQEEIGVKSLIKLSKTAPEFNELIIIAFESSISEFERYKLKHKKILPMAQEKDLTYAPRVKLAECIIDWLSRHKNSKE